MSVRSAFQLTTPLPPPSVLQMLHDRLSMRPGVMSGTVAQGRVELYVPSSRQHLWSPQLMVEVEALPAESESAGSVLRGRFGTHPHVWVMGIAVVALAGFGALVVLSLAYAQWAMGEPPTALVLLPLAGAVSVLPLLVRHIAETRGEEQVRELRAFLEDGVAQTERDPDSVRPDGLFMRRSKSPA